MPTKITLAAIGFLLVIAPATTSAATLSELQVQLQTILRQLSTLQSTSTSGAGASPQSGAAPSASCPNLTRNLFRGMKGSDVMQLQQFFVSQKLLASDSATGFFGAMTEVAVKQWQAKNGIASSGTPANTGWGSVGPKTRNAITASCNKFISAPPRLPSSGKTGTVTTNPTNPATQNQTPLQPAQIASPTPSSTPSLAPITTVAPVILQAQNVCNVFRYEQDVYMGILKADGSRLFDFRLGSGGVISSLRGPDYQELLAKSFSGERTDRVIQWSLWSKTDLYSVTGSGSKESSEWYSNAFNVTQAGSINDRAGEAHLQDTLWVEGSTALCTVDIYSAASHQWLPQLDEVFSTKFQSLMRYTITADRAIHIQRFILIPRAFDEFRIDAWSPFAKSDLDRLTFDMNDSGTQASVTGAQIGYLDQNVATFQSGKGYAVLFKNTEALSKPAIGVVFGNKQPCNGSPCAPLGSDTSDAIANAQTIVDPTNHPCKKLPAGCGWNTRTINVMDWTFGAQDQGIAVIPTTHLSGVPAGSLYIDEMYLVVRPQGLSSEIQSTASRLSQSISAPQLIHQGQTVPVDIEAIRARLTAHNGYAGMQTDQMGVFSIPGI